MYPTQREILEKKVHFRQETLDYVGEWKKKFYNNGQWAKTDKNDAIKDLLKGLADEYSSPVGIEMEERMTPCYQHDNQTIFLDSAKPSILTALHEFAHHLYGKSEYRACRWSVWLFMQCFPRAYGKLVWKEHMLVKA